MGSVTGSWAEEIETAGRDELRKLQLEKLNRSLSYCAARSPFYRRKLAGSKGAGALRFLEELPELPLTSRAELEADQRTHGRAGTLLCTDYGAPGDAIGLTGVKVSATGVPLKAVVSVEDCASQGKLAARGLAGAGVTPADYLYVMDFPQFNLLYLHVGLGSINLGSKSILAGMERAKRNVRTYAPLFPPSAVYISPSYSKFVLPLLRESGRRYPIRTVLGWSEPGYSVPSVRETLTAAWQEVSEAPRVDLRDVYGMVEVGLLGFSCSQKAGLHGFEDAYLYEVVDPVSGDVLPPGREGELVITHLERTAMPLVRYRTGDVTSLTSEPCACGRTHLRLSGIKGRLSQRLEAQGKTLYPADLEQALARSGYGGPFNAVTDAGATPEGLSLDVSKAAMAAMDPRGVEESCSGELGVTVRLEVREDRDLLAFPHRAVKCYPSRDFERLRDAAARQWLTES
ncbi:MAG: hypothetical protein HY900_24210 [Deltaproteobacteria bacterium]|nr:hypothetical protein [Deltaproteobacteria bacterium]